MKKYKIRETLFQQFGHRLTGPQLNWLVNFIDTQRATKQEDKKDYRYVYCCPAHGEYYKVCKKCEEDKKECKHEKRAIGSIICLDCGKNLSTPSLLNDIETIEEIKHELWRFPLDSRSQESGVGEHQHKVIVAIDKKINSLIKNQRILIGIIKLLPN